MKRLDKYLIREVALPFLAAQTVMLVLYLGTEALTEATKLIGRFGLDPFRVMMLLLYRIPWALAWTMPMSSGMAVILAIGRLCRDTEYTAMLAGGMSFRRVLLPMLLFATLLTGVALWIQEFVGPAGMMAYHREKLTLQAKAEADLLEVHFRLNSYNRTERVTLTAARLDAKAKKLYDIDLSVSEDGRKQYEVHAAWAAWEPEVRRWKLYDGQVEDRRSDPPMRFSFDESDVQQLSSMAGQPTRLVFEDTPNNVSIAATDKPDYLTYHEIRERLRLMREKDAPPREINRTVGYLHRRWTLATSCFLFMLVGAPLAVKPQRAASLGSAFALGVGLVMVYYVAWNATSYLAEGMAVPWIWCWSTNIVGTALGLWLTTRVID